MTTAPRHRSQDCAENGQTASGTPLLNLHPSNWLNRRSARTAGQFPQMIESLRSLLDHIVSAAAPPSLIAEATATLTTLADKFGGHIVEEHHRIYGRLGAVPGRGQVLVPKLHIDGVDHGAASEGVIARLTGRVEVGEFHAGANGACHGGVIPLLFDDVLGALAHIRGRSMARTAYLRVDYRSITPIGRELRVDARFEREEGRKRLLRGSLSDGDRVCAEAEGLFVALRPGQP